MCAFMQVGVRVNQPKCAFMQVGVRIQPMFAFMQAVGVNQRMCACMQVMSESVQCACMHARRKGCT
jgi:hypothetical protein